MSNFLDSLLNRLDKASEIQKVIHDDRVFVDRKVHELTEPIADPLKVYTLQALVDYLASDIDNVIGSQGNPGLMIHVESPTKVYLRSSLSNINERTVFVVADASQYISSFPFGQWLDQSRFIAEIQSNFVALPKSENGQEMEGVNDINRLLAYAGTISKAEISKWSDDGVTCSTMNKQGFEVERTKTPNRVNLLPFRTFQEIAQPGSEFVLRLKPGKQENSIPELRLIEADGGAWKMEAVGFIRDWLEDRLKDKLAYIPILA